jgi:hypothetical protein
MSNTQNPGEYLLRGKTSENILPFFQCEYIDFEEDCKQCTSKGLYCRYFESGADPTVEHGFEEVGFGD